MTASFGLSGSDFINPRIDLKLISFLLVSSILINVPQAQADVLCSYNGPDRFYDLLEISNWQVNGQRPLSAGDTLMVSFSLKSVEVPVQFGEPGLFMAVRDPDGMNRDFGHIYQNSILEPEAVANFKDTFILDKEGEWTFWPSFYIIENPPYYSDFGERFAPDEWHACYFAVEIPNIPPTAYMDIYPNPASQGEMVTFEAHGADEDGEVVELYWDFPDGSVRTSEGDSDYFETGDFEPGWYSLRVRDDAGAWSETVTANLEISSEDSMAWLWLLLVIPVIFAAWKLAGKKVEEAEEKKHTGSIYANSDPGAAQVFINEEHIGASPLTHDVAEGEYIVKFRKFGYFDCERGAVVISGRTAKIHCDLTEIPGIRLGLSAESTQIPADGKSKSRITVKIEDNNGTPIPVPEDITIALETTKGEIETPVKIPMGHASATSILVSSTSSGTAIVKAGFEKILKNSIEVEFIEVSA